METFGEHEEDMEKQMSRKGDNLETIKEQLAFVCALLYNIYRDGEKSDELTPVDFDEARKIRNLNKQWIERVDRERRKE